MSADKCSGLVRRRPQDLATGPWRVANGSLRSDKGSPVARRRLRYKSAPSYTSFARPAVAYVRRDEKSWQKVDNSSNSHLDGLQIFSVANS